MFDERFNRRPDKGNRSEQEYSDGATRFHNGFTENSPGHVDHSQNSDPKFTNSKLRGETGLIQKEEL